MVAATVNAPAPEMSNPDLIREGLERNLAAPNAIRAPTDNSSETGQSAWKSVQGAAQWVAEGTKDTIGRFVEFGADTAARTVNAFEARRAQSSVNSSMGSTPVAAYQGRTQPAAANQQQSGYNRSATSPVNQPETLSQRFGNVFKNAAGYGLVAVAASGGALLAPVAVAAVAVIAAYKAIQALEAVMKLFKRDNKPQGQQQAPSGQQQQQPARQQVGQQQGQEQTGQQAQTPVAQATAQALPQGQQQGQEQTGQQAQQPTMQAQSQGQEQASNPGTSANEGGSITFDSNVNLDTGFNLEAYLQSIQGMGRG